MPDMLFILLLALVLLGPRKLPQLAAHAGKYLAQFQRIRREMMEQLSAELRHTGGGNDVQKSASCEPSGAALGGSPVEEASAR
jgi:sec-independent protein translocase protein TatB